MASHVRIGNIENLVSQMLFDADEARAYREYYLREKDVEKARFWEGKFEYARSTAIKTARDFKIQIEEPAI